MTIFKNFLKVCAVSACVSSAFAATQPTYSFSYQARIPATSQSCEEEAKDLASRISANADVSNAVGTCKGVVLAKFDGTEARLYSLALTYNSKNYTTVYSAAIGGLYDITSTTGEMGSFATYSECVEQIGVQSDRFEDATNLPVLAAYCSPVNVYHGGYILNVDGYGRPARTLRVVHPYFGVSELKKLFTSYGVVIVRTEGDAVYFYADSNFAFNQASFGLFAEEADCEKQLDDVKNLFAAMGAKTTLARCRHDETTFGTYEMIGAGDLRWGLMAASRPTQYYSLDECLGSRADELAQYGKNAYGALCRPNPIAEGQFTMDVYTK
jgi:hypothetical protein